MIIRHAYTALVAVGTDGWYDDIVRACEANDGQWERWRWRNGTLFRRDKYGDDHIVLRDRATTSRALTEAHKGHAGVRSMLKTLRISYWWPSMAKDVKDKVARCTECARFGPRLPIEPAGRIFVHQPFDVLLFDFVSGLPESNGRSAFIVGIDAYSGFVRAESVKKMTAEVAKSFFINAFLLVFGAPRVVHTDNGTHFLGSFHDFVTGLGVRHCFSSPHFPRAHGKVERVHRMLLDQLRKAHSGFSWPSYLPVAAWHVNTRSPKEDRAPLELLMGVRPRGDIERHVINAIEPPDVPEDAEREAYMDVVRQGGADEGAVHQVHQGHHQAPQEPFSNAPQGPDYAAPQGRQDRAPQEHRAPQGPQRVDKGKRDRYKTGDLVWVYDHGARKGVGRKLVGKWRGPAVVVWVGSQGGVVVRDTFGGVEKRVNISDIKRFVQ